MTVRLSMVGLGYWGPNLARNLAAANGAELAVLCDADADRLTRFRKSYPDARFVTSYEDVVADEAIDAVALATPVHTHFEMAAAALRAGKHVFVEKPLAASVDECEQLVQIAAAADLRLMVGHVFLFNTAVQRVKAYIDSGELGEIYYVYSQRLNLGVVRSDVNALWNFAPHDFSILDHWLGAEPVEITARGFSYLQPAIEDVVFMSMTYPGGIGANVHISWLDPHKVRRMTVVGSEKMVVYDDVSQDAKLMLFDKGVTKKRLDDAYESLGPFKDFAEFQLLLRAGDVLIPKVDSVEPLAAECQHFVDCVVSGTDPLTNGASGLRTVRALERAQQSLEDGATG
jgi:predicted dehydrogenase